MKLKDLSPNPQNPRKVSDAKLKMLKASLDEFGPLDGFIYNTRTKRLAGGHQRLKVLPQDSEIFCENGFGYVMVNGEKHPYREVDWDEVKEKAANIAANKGAGEWDFPQLTDWMLELDQFNFNMDLTMFDEKERENLIVGKYEPTEGEDNVPEPPKIAKTKTGELWILGEHRLLVGDCTVKENVERLMGGEKADLWLTDAPYGVDLESKHAAMISSGRAFHAGKIHNDNHTLEEMKVFWRKAAESAIIATHDKASYYWFACQGGDQMMMMMMSISEANWKVRHELIWVKDSFVLGRCDYHYQHEPILYGWKIDGTHEWFGDRCQASVLKFDKHKTKQDHPSSKPVELLETLIRNSSPQRNARVYDGFLGSGSTLIACEKTNRRCFGCEIDPVYCDVILDRFKKFSGKEPVREDGVTWLSLQ